MFNKRRNEIDIIENILDLSKNGAKKTEILYKSNMSFIQLNNYLNYMMDKNIIKEKTTNNDGSLTKKIYISTDKGKKLLSDITKIKSYFE